MEDYDYTHEGEEGKTCADCINFRADIEDPTKGICFGREVLATGCCKFFKERN